MSPRNILWITVPILLSACVIWLSAQDKTPPEGVKVGEMAERVQAREKAVSVKEAALAKLEQRLNTLQATLAKEQERQQKVQEKLESDIRAREKVIEEEKAKMEAERKREVERIRELEKKIELERVQELEKIRAEQTRKLTVTTVDEQLVRTFEAMEPANAARALQELAKTNFDVSVGLLAVMSPKKAARVLDQLVPLDTKLAGDLSERLGLLKK